MRIGLPIKGDLLVQKAWDVGTQREGIWNSQEKGFGGAREKMTRVQMEEIWMCQI